MLFFLLFRPRITKNNLKRNDELVIFLSNVWYRIPMSLREFSYFNVSFYVSMSLIVISIRFYFLSMFSLIFNIEIKLNISFHINYIPMGGGPFKLTLNLNSVGCLSMWQWILSDSIQYNSELSGMIQYGIEFIDVTFNKIVLSGISFNITLNSLMFHSITLN